MKHALLFFCAFLLLTTNLLAITFEQRVDAQRAIERVYYNHRIWPKENPAPKPPLEVILPEASLRAKVEDYLQKSDALDLYWQRPITAQQLQAEMDRMARETKQPAALRELFVALGNDPQLIAECLARPILADRLIHNMYAGDERFHGTLKRQVESELAVTNTVEAMRALSGSYRESAWAKQQAKTFERLRNVDGSIVLDPQEWKDWTGRLRQKLGGFPARTVSQLLEESDRYYVVAILEKSDAKLRLATVEWMKQSFDEWWAEAKSQTRAEIPLPVCSYTLPQELLVRIPTADNAWRPTYTGPPHGRYVQTAVWTGAEMIVWGGYWNDGAPHFENTGGRYNPATDAWAAGGISTSGSPAGRAGHSAVWTGAEMVVWGGSDGLNQLNTGGRYNPTTDTWVPGGTSLSSVPTGRINNSAVWTGSEMIVWGGLNGTTPLNTGGRYNPTTDTWASGGTSISNAPTGRHNHTAVWTGAEMIVWGGYDGVNFVNTGGRYNPVTDAWAASGTSTTGVPSQRYIHTAIWTGIEMIVWGGYTGSYLNTGGRYNPTTDTWAAGGTSMSNAPTGRYYHTAVWTSSEMIIWGGRDAGSFSLSSGGRYNPTTDTWAAGGTSITNAPTARLIHTAIWTGTEMIVWGGYDGGNVFNSGGRYNPVTDSWVAGGTSTLAAPVARQNHTTVWTGAEMIVWGGQDIASNRFSTGGLYNPATDSWAAGGTSTSGAPTARFFHEAIWTGAQMIVWGGFDGVFTNTGGRYNPATDTWAAGGTSTTNAPTGRTAHTAIWTGSEMIVWGGYWYDGSPHYENTGGRYSPSSDAWVPSGISLVNAPTAREWHTALWTGSEMLIWGGDNSIALKTGGRYSPTSDAWASGGISIAGAPAGCEQHTAIWTGTEMIVWGGYDGVNFVNTGGRYNPVTDAWAANGTSNTGAPTARASHTAVWTGALMIVWGGFDGVNRINTGGRYNPATDIWIAGGTSTTGSPTQRALHTAVWTGSDMIVWGGSDGPTCLNTGGQYSVSNNPPVAVDDSTSTPKDAPVTITVLSNDSDPDGDALSLTGVTPATNGLAVKNADGTVTYTPNTGYTGADSFTYTISDGQGGIDSATVNITVTQTCLFCDDFTDGVLDWSYLKPSWSETGGNLVATPKRKAIAVADTVFPAGCHVCSVEAEMQTAGGVGNKMWLLGWYADKNNTLELLIKEENDKVILRQKAGGRIVKKAAIRTAISANINYNVKVAFNGTQFDVSINGTHLFTFLPAGTVPTGTVGFAVKNTIGTFGSINVQ